MLIVTNPGSNLSAALAARFGILLTPQHIVVDGALYDTRADFGLSQVDEWVETATTHPYVLGTSAAAYAALFTNLHLRGRSGKGWNDDRRRCGSRAGVCIERPFAGASRDVSFAHCWGDPEQGPGAPALHALTASALTAGRRAQHVSRSTLMLQHSALGPAPWTRRRVRRSIGRSTWAGCWVTVAL